MGNIVQLPEVSAKNTKDQILAAYNKAMAQIAEKQGAEPVTSIKNQQEATVTEAVKIMKTPILEELGNLKIRLLKETDMLAETLSKEIQTLTTVRDAIAIEQATLKDLYQINQNAHTLEALIKAQKDEREQFDQMMAGKKEEWQKKLVQIELDYKERASELEKTRKREEEDHNYTKELTRRKENDAYLAKKDLLEKEMNEKQENLQKREEAIAQQEKLLLDLQKKVETFDQEMDKQVKQAEGLLSEKLGQEHKFALDLMQRDADAKLKLAEQKSLYLEQKIQEQEQLMKQLNTKMNEASTQMQQIACRALDTSAQRFVPAGMGNANDGHVTAAQK